MKKLLLLTVLLFLTLAVKSQDIKRFRSMTKQEAIQFSNQISSDIREDWVLHIEKETSKAFILSYIPLSTSEEQLKKIGEVGLSSSGVIFFKVAYEVFYEGKDLDMEINGIKKYRFFSTTLKFLDAFPVWKKYFFKEATIEGVKSYDGRVRRIDSLFWLYKFEPTNRPYWTINKFY